MGDRVLSYDFQLSPNTKVIVVFDGDDPDAGCFARLREFLAITEKALIAAKPQIVKQARRKPELPPCEKHPNAPRSEGPRRDCVECRKAHTKLMVAARHKAS